MADQRNWTAQRWAIEISKLWRAVARDARFPVDVEAIAPDLSATWFPSDPVKAIKGGPLPNFEGALYPLDEPATGWAIIYNESGVKSWTEEVHDFPRIRPFFASPQEAAKRHPMRRAGRQPA